MAPGVQRRKRGGSSMKGRRGSTQILNQLSQEELQKQKQREQYLLNRLKCTNTSESSTKGILKDQAEVFPYKRRAALNYLRDRKLLDVLTLHNIPNRRIQAKSLKRNLPNLPTLQQQFLKHETEVDILKKELEHLDNLNLLENINYPAITSISSFRQAYEYFQRKDKQLNDAFAALMKNPSNDSVFKELSAEEKSTSAVQNDNLQNITKDSEKNEVDGENAKEIPVDSTKDTEKSQENILSSVETVDNLISSDRSRLENDDNTIREVDNIEKNNPDNNDSKNKNIADIYVEIVENYRYKHFSEIYTKNTEQLSFIRGDFNTAPANYWEQVYPEYLKSKREKEEAKIKLEAERKQKEEEEKQRQRLEEERKLQQEQVEKELALQLQNQRSEPASLVQAIGTSSMFAMDGSISGSVPGGLPPAISVSASLGSMSGNLDPLSSKAGIQNQVQTSAISGQEHQQQTQNDSAMSLLQELNDPNLFGRNPISGSLLQQQPSGTDLNQEQTVNQDDKQSNLDDQFFNDFGTFDTEFGDNAFADFDPAFF